MLESPTDQASPDGTSLAALPTHENIEMIFTDQPIAQLTNSSELRKRRTTREDGTTLPALPKYDNIEIFADRGAQEYHEVWEKENNESTGSV